MYRDMVQSAARVKNPKTRTLRFGPFTGGLVTSRPAEQLRQNECTEATNLVIDSSGMPRTRPGLSSFAAGAGTEKIKSVKDIEVGGTWYTFVSVTVGTTYRLYYENSGSLVQIGTDTNFEGEISFCGFNDVLIIFDGGYLKYWDGSGLYLASDQGLGSKASYLFQNENAELSTTTQPSYSAVEIYTTTKVGIEFTTPASLPDLSTPALSFSLYMARTNNGATAGNENEPVKIVVRNATTYTSHGTIDLIVASGLPQLADPDTGIGEDISEYLLLTGTMASADFSTPLAESTDYLFCVEFDDGDATHAPVVLTVQTLAANQNCHLYNGSWSEKSGEAVVSNLALSFAPQLKYGLVHNSRLFGIEGSDGDNPDYVWYSGAGNHLDWSSSNSGGYLTAGFSVNAIASFYDSVLLFGSEKNPILKRLSGATPAAFSLTSSIQSIGAYQKTLVTTSDDLIFLHSAGVGSIRTMQEYGDLRSATRSDNIKPEITDNFDSAALAAYEPKYGLYLLKLNDGNNQTLYALHTKLGGGRYIVTKWVLAAEGTPDAISSLNVGEGCVYIGTEGGNIYKIDYTTLQDASTTPSYTLKSGITAIRHRDLAATDFSISLMSDGGCTANIKFYRNYSTTALWSKAVTVPASKAAAQPDAGSTSYFEALRRHPANFEFQALMVGYENVVPTDTTEPVFFGDIEVLAE